jgi:1-acyl-sn-glycerol-3-phosphate acyltransferase
VSRSPGVVNHACRLTCIADDDVAPQASLMRYALRQIGLVATHVLAVVFGFLSVLLTRRAARRLLRVWARTVVRAAGIRVEVDGALPRSGPMLVVANHVSSFDALAMVARVPGIVSVATHHIRQDPIVGRITRNSGTIFVNGTTSAAVRTMVRDLAGALRAGHVVLVYPEGSMRCREPGGSFPPAVLQCAITTNTPVQPVLIRCVLRDGTPTAQGGWFVHDESVMAMVRRVLRIRGLVLKIRTFPAIDAATARDRRELALLAKAPLDSAAGPMPHTCVAVAPNSAARERHRLLAAGMSQDSRSVQPEFAVAAKDSKADGKGRG